MRVFCHWWFVMPSGWFGCVFGFFGFILFRDVFYVR